MAIVKVVKSKQRARRARPLLNYLTKGQGHRAGVPRYEQVLTTNGMPTRPQIALEAFRAVREKFRNPRAKHEVHHVVMSFGDGELEAGANGVHQAAELARAFASEAWPTRQVFGVVQRDGEGGKTHVHLAVGNLDVLTGKAARGDEMSWTRLAPIMDATLHDHGLKQPENMPQAGVIPEFKRRGHTKAEHEKLAGGNRKFAIEAIARAKGEATSREEFEDFLEAEGVAVELTPPNARKKYGAARYTVNGEEFTGGSLGKGAGYKAIFEAISANAAAQARGQEREAVAADEELEELLEKARGDAREEFAGEKEMRLRQRSSRSRKGKKLTPARERYLRELGALKKNREYEG